MYWRLVALLKNSKVEREYAGFVQVCMLNLLCLRISKMWENKGDNHRCNLKISVGQFRKFENQENAVIFTKST